MDPIHKFWMMATGNLADVRLHGTQGLRQLREKLGGLFRTEIQRFNTSREPFTDESVEKIVETLLSNALQDGASDIHLDPESEVIDVRFRIDGRLHDVMTLERDLGEHIIRHFKAVSGLNPASGYQPDDARYNQQIGGRDLDIRLAVAPTVCGDKLSLRLLDRSQVLTDVAQLGLQEHHLRQINEWLSAAGGMFLVTGPTGSGKTTTLYSLLHQLKLFECSVVTLEDPVEYQIDGIVQIQIDEKRGLDFSEGLKSVLHLDPDYILLGEIRDAESARLACRAAVTGRVVMSTLHSRDAIGAVTALRQWGLQDHHIGTVLEVIVAQRLVRKLCPHCRKTAGPTKTESAWLDQMEWKQPDQVWQAVGCDACRGTGYSGRTGLFEIWHLDQDDRERILAHEDEDGLRRAVSAHGIRPLFADGLEKIAQGVTSLEELCRLSPFCHFQPERP